MSYIVLARKYRPQIFDEVTGQEHITELLKKAIEVKRIAHAYLFCGPRGVGKTSCARIFAKCLNCKEGPALKPCGKCSACLEIAQTNNFDVIEIDGASNRGIDEIRTLRENVKFAPSYGRYKIYIVDEVHMLTTEAFNALLKTLEEPPEHVKFILATTSPNKIPATIISRCQRFDFRRIAIEAIIKKLASICTAEKFKIEEEALFAIAKAASGSLRDSLSILDQLGALSQRNIKADDVFSMLGMVETQLLFDLADCLAKKDCAAALLTLDKIVERGKDIKQLTRDIIEHFRNLMIIKIGGKSLGKLVDYPIATKEVLLSQSDKFLLSEILKAIDIFLEAQETARAMDSLRMPLEVAFAKLTNAAEGNSSAADSTFAKPAVEEKPASQKANFARPSPINVLTNQKGQVDFSSAKNEEPLEEQPVAVQEEGADFPELTIEKIKTAWDAITYAISREKMSAATFLQEGYPFEIKGNKLVIVFSSDAAFHKESLQEKDNLKLIQRIFSEKLRQEIIIELKTAEHEKANHDHEPILKEALETFKGKVVNKWHKE